MKKIIYKNVISLIVLIILPWYVFDQEYYWNILSFDRNYLFIIVFVGVLYLLYSNTRSAIKSKGRGRVASIIFIIPPALVIAYFVLGYIAFSRYKILG
mgnify:FL=1